MKYLILMFLLAGQLSNAAEHKVLFLGNSITRHGPKADIGWTGNWGMAATAEDKDFVHLVTAGLTKKWGGEPKTMVQSLVDFERGYATFDPEAKLKEAVAFHADLIIIAIGENVPDLKNAEQKSQFAVGFAAVLKRLQADYHPTIIVRSCFWADAAKDQILKQTCDDIHGIFVNIDTLGKDESNYARAERTIAHAGVGAHPGDKGMRAIADAILAAVKEE